MNSNLTEIEILMGIWLMVGEFTPRERLKYKGDYKALFEIFKTDDRGMNKDFLKSIYTKSKEYAEGIILPGEKLFDGVFSLYSDMPCGLFYKGDINLLLNKCITIAGTRNPSEYGKRVTKDIIKNLEGSAYTIVSGGALGIDSIAHAEALKWELKTICVLGCGVDYVYPPANLDLFKSIIRNGGLIVSEYLPWLKPKKYFFPERNRIMAQLGEVLIIPEATEVSGSLHTADCADTYGKRIITVPHEIYEPSGKGCNNLISMGAEVLISPEDIKSYLYF